ncbi:hypothetical protein AWENTII_005319 [Aspergillus wentii]
METAEIPLMTQEEQKKGSDEDGSENRGWMLRAWRFTIASGAMTGAIVLLANIITLAVIYGRFDVADHSITFFTGSCKTASTVTTVAHVIINILSTILLAASNFSMQCLASPTRKEVNQAHSNRRWLSIGTPNIRNIVFVSKSKALLWLILAASSFPLHTVWNSTVFETRSTNDYLITAATEDFFNGTEWKYAAALYGSSMTHTEWGMASDIISHLQHEAISSRSGNSSTGLERLDVDDCIKAYAQDELSDRRHLLLVIDGHQYDTNGTVLGMHNSTYSVDGDPLFAWMCDKYALIGYDYIWKCVHNLPGKKWTLGDTTFNSYPGTPLNDAPIQYCYSETTPEKCKASIVPLFLIVVIICNVIKILCFLFTLRITKADPPLCTTGDAIQSFLQKPDPHTKGRCLVSKQDYESYISRSDEWQSRASNIGDLWDGGRWRWNEAIHLFQWLFYTACLSAVIIAGGVLYDPGRKGVKGSGIVALGIGQPRASFRATENGVSGLLTGFIEANVPQLIVSYIYLALNNMMTTMLAMAEWCVQCGGKRQRQRSPCVVTSPEYRAGVDVYPVGATEMGYPDSHIRHNSALAGVSDDFLRGYRGIYIDPSCYQRVCINIRYLLLATWNGHFCLARWCVHLYYCGHLHIQEISRFNPTGRVL